MKKALPQGWIKTSLGNICKEINSGSGFPVKYQGQDAGDYPFAKVGDLSRLYRSGKNTINSANNYISRKQQKEIKARVFLEKTIVFPKIGEALKNNYRLLTKRKMLFDNNVMGVTPDQDIVSPEFIYYFLLTQDFGKFSVATAIPSIRKGDIESIEILLPPEHEQKSIVAKIEELFSELDSGIASLKTAQEQLKIYRQALLKHAFEGKLTEQWRKDNADKLETPEQLLARIQTERETRYQQQLKEWKQAVKDWEAKGKGGKKPTKPKVFEKNGEADNKLTLGLEIPESWKLMPIGLVFSVFVGATPSRKNPKYWNGDINWVSSGEVSFCSIYQTKEKISQEGYENTSTEIHPKGTVLLAMIGEGKTRGQAAILRIPAAHNQNTAAIRVSEIGLPSEYIYYFLQYQYEQTRKAGSGNNQKALNKSRVSSIIFPLCSIAEQQEIVSQLEEKLSIIEQNEKEIESALAKAELLRQSILKKAFSGQLIS